MAVTRAALHPTQGVQSVKLGLGPSAVLQQLWRPTAQNTGLQDTNGTMCDSTLSRRCVAGAQRALLPSVALTVHHLSYEGSPGPATSFARANPKRILRGLLAILPPGALHVLTLSIRNQRSTAGSPLESNLNAESNAQRFGRPLALQGPGIPFPAAVY